MGIILWQIDSTHPTPHLQKVIPEHLVRGFINFQDFAYIQYCFVTANQTQTYPIPQNVLQCSKGKYPKEAEEMPTKKEDKKELRHSEWVEQIAECQSSGMKI